MALVEAKLKILEQLWEEEQPIRARDLAQALNLRSVNLRNTTTAATTIITSSGRTMKVGNSGTWFLERKESQLKNVYEEADLKVLD
jgi:repressor of nif and glnA expression